MREAAIIPATVAHARAIAARIRPEDAAETAALGLESIAATVESFERSLRSWTLVQAGQPIAIWGVGAESILDDVGMPWMITAHEIHQNRVRLARISRAAVARMLRIFPRLENWVDARYTVCVRYLGWIGFTVHPAEPYGPLGMPFRRFEMTRS